MDTTEAAAEPQTFDEGEQIRSPAKTILYVIGSLDLGGAERHVVTIAARLKALGWQPTVYCFSSRGSQADQLERSGVEVIGPPSDNRVAQTRAERFLRLLASTAKLFILMALTRPTIVHFFLPAAYIIGAPLAIVARIPIRVMSRRSLSRYQMKYPILRRAERCLHRYMHMLLGNSQAVVGELRTETNGRTPIDLIYNGVGFDYNTLQRSKNEMVSSLSGTIVLIIVANLIPYKGHFDLFHALAIADQKLPPSWKILCVGRDDGLAASLQHLAHSLKIDSHIQLLGARSDVADLLAIADIGILSSHEEGFSNAILEGMASGLPMVVTNVGGNAEAIIDGECGFVVPPKNPEALAAAIVKLASDPELRHNMGEAARRRAHSLFSLEQCVHRYDEIYRRLIRDKFRGPA